MHRLPPRGILAPRQSFITHTDAGLTPNVPSYPPGCRGCCAEDPDGRFEEEAEAEAAPSESPRGCVGGSDLTAFASLVPRLCVECLPDGRRSGGRGEAI